MDNIISNMEQYKKDAGHESLSYTNKIAEEQAVLQHIEAEKAALMIGNEEKTEILLKKTSEHGIILMSIKSLFQKIATKTEQNGGEVNFIWRMSVPQPRTDDQHQTEKEKERETVYDPEECYNQLDVIREYIEGFQAFTRLLNEPIDQDIKGVQKNKQTYF